MLCRYNLLNKLRVKKKSLSNLYHSDRYGVSYDILNYDLQITKLSKEGEFLVLRLALFHIVAMFKERKTPCPFGKTTLKQEKDSFNCLGTTDVYHCLLDERNRSGEMCHQPIWVPKGRTQLY